MHGGFGRGSFWLGVGLSRIMGRMAKKRIGGKVAIAQSAMYQSYSAFDIFEDREPGELTRLREVAFSAVVNSRTHLLSRSNWYE